MKIPERLRLTLALLLLGLLLILLLKYLFPLLAPFVLGLVIAYLIKTPVKFIQCRLGFSRPVAVVVVLAVTVIVVGLLLTLCLARLYHEIRSLLLVLPEQVTIWSAAIDRLIFEMTTWLRLPGSYWEHSKLKPENFFATISSLLQGTLNIFKRFPVFLFQFFFSGFAAYFLSRDQEKIKQFFFSFIPEEWKKPVLWICREILRSGLGYINLQFLLGIITGSLSTTLLWVFGFPRPWLFGLILGLMDLIPMLGPLLFFLPWIGWELATGDFKTLFDLVIITLLILGVRQLLEVRLVGERLGLHPLLVLFALYIGVRIMGGFGFFFGPILVIMIRSCYQGITSYLENSSCCSPDLIK